MASELAASAQTGELILFHHEPSYTDEIVAAQETAAKNIFPNSRAAYEGLEIKLALTPSLLPLGEGKRMDVKYVENG